MTLDDAYQAAAFSIAQGRPPQATLVAASPRGAGGEYVRRVLARLLCREPDPPCGHCKRCLNLDRGLHPDVHRLEPQLKSRVIGIDPMREFLRDLQNTSFEGGWKAGVILSADCMNASSANAFLKTLEEPPPQTIFFLVTDSPQRLLPTVLSRCQRVAIESSDYADVPSADREALLDILGDTTVAGIAGAFGTADRLASLFKARKAQIEKEEKARIREDEDESLDKETQDARVGARYREWRQSMLTALIHWYRDQLVLVCDGGRGLLAFPEAVEVLETQALASSLRQVMERVRAVEEAAGLLNRHLSESLVFEHLFLKLRS